MTLVTLRPSARVEIGGVARTLLRATTTAGPRAAYSTATLILDPAEGRPDVGAFARVWAGYDGRVEVLFTGEVDVDGVSLAPTELEVRCTGILGRTREPIGAPPSITDGATTPAFLVSWAGATAATIIGDILAAYGIGGASLEDPGRTYGNVAPVGLTGADPGWAIIADLDEIEGYRTFDAPDGTVRRVPLVGIPAGTGATLQQGVDLYTGRLDESRTSTFNRIIATGLPQQTIDGATVVPAEELNAPSPWVPTPPTYRAFTYQSPLLETAEDCGRYAARKLGELNRLRGELPFELATGTTALRPAMTVGVSSAVLDARGEARYWVSEVVHDLGEGGFQTSGTLLLASRGSGWSPNQAPVAVIDFILEVEYLEGLPVWVGFADGSASYDPDAPVVDDPDTPALEVDPRHGITSYAWSGVPTAPTAPTDQPRATYVWHTDPTGATVTLTVGDTHLKHGSATVTITATMVAQAVRRDLWAAVTSDLLLTTDGGATWQALGVPATVIAEIAHPNYQLAASAAGALSRITVDNAGAVAVTAIASPTGVTALHINLGPDGTGTHRCWAGCAGGQTWLSRDDGVTWRARGTIDLVAGASSRVVRHIEESPYSFGTLHALSGPAVWRSYDEGVTWEQVLAYPDVALTASRFASGRYGPRGAEGSYHWAAFAGTSADTASRVQETAGAAALDWPAAARPAQPSGLTSGVYAPELLLTDTVAGGRSWYLADGTADGELEERAYGLALGVPRHIIRDGRIDGIVYGAAESSIFKTFDKFVSTAAIRTLTSPMSGAMVAYGKLRGAVAPVGLLVSSYQLSAVPGSSVVIGSTVNQIIRLAVAGGWTVVAAHPVPVSAHPTIADFPGFVNYGASSAWVAQGPANLAFVRPLLRGPDTSLFTYCFASYAANLQGCNPTYRNVYKSVDGGATWAALTGVAGVTSLACDGSGQLWAVVGNGGAIARSRDGGATWAAVVGSGPVTYTSRYTVPAIWPWLDKWTGVAAPVQGGSGGYACATCPAGVVTTSDAFAGHGWCAFNQYAAAQGPPGVVPAPAGDAFFADVLTAAGPPAAGAATGAIRVPGDGGVFSFPAPLATDADPWRVETAYRRSWLALSAGLVFLCGSGLHGVWASADGGASFGDICPDGTLGIAQPATHAAAADPAGGAIALGLIGATPTGAGAFVAYIRRAGDGGEWADITGNLVAATGGVSVAHPSGMLLT